MTETSEQILLEKKTRNAAFRMRPVAIVLLPFVAVLYKAYVSQFIEQLAYLELPLLVTLYFSLMWRNQLAALFYGAGVGLLEDSLASHPIGLFGIAKTLVGYFAASVSLRFDVDHAAIRFILVFFFFIFHSLFYWVMDQALLGVPRPLEPAQTFIVAGLNAAAAIPLFMLFDKMKERA
ncbi:MAG TPA: rod shape-determining protein MreD [Bryobacteraceae bacterium]|jgi:rod shape-determining protein MreD